MTLDWRRHVVIGWRRGLGLGLTVAVSTVCHAAPPPWLSPCRLQGIEHEALCGVLSRPLDPAAAAGRQIDVHVAVLPALARNKKPDPVFFFAGGPGQSAIELAGNVQRMLVRLSNRRDMVLIDQRGTGRSAPLRCARELPTRPLALTMDTALAQRELDACRVRLQALPHGDLRQYTTSIAVADADAVRQRLGAEQINLVGVSYGTRVALEYLRQFPAAVRRVVIDGVAPPDMVLPAASSQDNQAALDALFTACDDDAACAARYPALRQKWRALLTALPQTVRLTHPVTGLEESVTLGRDAVLGLVRQPLYVPALAAALPLAISEAAAGRFSPLFGLASSLDSSRRGTGIAQGMHLSVLCSEDEPRVAQATDRPGADFGRSFAEAYRRSCADWPRAVVPAAFLTVTRAEVATLVLSGGVDPATPARHGERIAQALGPKARHVVVANAGHGVLGLGCMRDVVYRFIDALDDGAAAEVDARCAAAVPRPPTFKLPQVAP